MPGHASSNSFSNRHVSEWKNRFNELPVRRMTISNFSWIGPTRWAGPMTTFSFSKCLDFVDPGAQVSLLKLSPNLKFYLSNFYQFITSHLVRSKDQLKLKGINPDSPHPSLSGNNDAAGSEYGSLIWIRKALMQEARVSLLLYGI